MDFRGQRVKEIIITATDGEVLAVISDSEIVEKNGISVIVNWS